MLAQVPDEWLEATPDDAPAEVRARYVDQLLARLAARDAWLPGSWPRPRPAGGAPARAARREPAGLARAAAAGGGRAQR